MLPLRRSGAALSGLSVDRSPARYQRSILRPHLDRKTILLRFAPTRQPAQETPRLLDPVRQRRDPRYAGNRVARPLTWRTASPAQHPGPPPTGSSDRRRRTHAAAPTAGRESQRRPRYLRPAQISRFSIAAAARRLRKARTPLNRRRDGAGRLAGVRAGLEGSRRRACRLRLPQLSPSLRRGGGSDLATFCRLSSRPHTSRSAAPPG